VFWDHTAVNVLTLEEIDGIACTDIHAMDELGIDRKNPCREWSKDIF
jgi:predicted unusual protein kinase regulating ubiquinone biosynthesis (AarF/ABC1/UbiB family)